MNPVLRFSPRIVRSGLLWNSAFWILAGSACSSGPTSPLEIGQLNLGAAYDVFVREGTAYVANNEGVAILDIGDIRRPRRVNLISGSSEGGVAGFQVFGDTLVTFGNQLSLYDIRQPQTPILLARYTGRDFIGAVHLRDNFLYLGYLHGGLEIVSLGGPGGATSIGYSPFSGQINGLALKGDFAFIANSSTGLELFDISDPTHPQKVRTVQATPGAWDIHLLDERLYLSCHHFGVRILDVSDPSDARVMGSLDNGGEAYGVFALGNSLYVADLQDGVEVLDISSPGSPTLVMWDRHYHPHDLFSDGRYLYLADQDAHFVVLPLGLSEGQ
jgi:hypothetical protein